MFGRIVEAAEEGGLFAGLNFWGWGGLAGQSKTNIYWQPGDDYCGDPAQEQQGLNSVYACDASTVAIIKEATDAIAKAILPKAEVAFGENDGVFEGNGPHKVQVNVNMPVLTKAEIQLEVSTDFGAPVTVLSKPAADGMMEFELDLDPGFYNAVLYAVHNGVRTELDRTNLGFNPEQIISEQDKQPDFDSFWTETLAQLSEVEIEPEYTLLKEYSNEVRQAFRVEMKSFGGETISGLLYLPVADGKYPAMISYMGYGSEVWYPDPSSNPQMIEFQLCVRNQAFNRKPGEKDDWLARGIESKETYYYRGAFADAVRAIDFVCSLDKTDIDLVFANGESQGGALTLVAASLDGRLKAIAPSAPFLNDYKDYFALVDWPGNPIKAAAQAKGMSDDELYTMLSYFDVKNFTDRIQCPVIMAIGLQDNVCPPHTNFAGYNHIRTEKSWICYPEAFHNVWEQPEWPVAKYDFFEKFM